MKEAWLKYKEWWANLASRERKAVLVLGFALFIFIIYEWAFLPYLETIADLRKQIKVGEMLVDWMQRTDKAIRQFENEHQGVQKIASPVLLLGKIQKQIDRAGLHDSLTQLKQVANDSIAMHFQKVEFDKWINLIISFTQNESVTITQMTVVADSTQGLVNADVSLRV